MDFNAKRVKAVDLVVLPPEIEGKNCGNCHNFLGGYCDNPKVLMSVERHWGCKEWNHPGAKPVKPQKSKFTLEYFKKQVETMRKDVSRFIDKD
jgi:hypothetical protein